MKIKFNKSETLIIVALEDECPRDLLVGWRVVYSGIGKVNALIGLSKAISEKRPKTVINFGTAGSSDPSFQGLKEVTTFKQRDMDVSPLGFKIGETPFDDINEIILDRPGLSCGTGDNFVSFGQNIDTDLFDMEAYAIAKFCLHNELDFYCYKFVSDNANDEAAEDWKKNVSNGAMEFKSLIG
jgi:adenosylhomocysteine nucleosidase